MPDNQDTKANDVPSTAGEAPESEGLSAPIDREDKEMEGSQDLVEKLSRLEKVIRGMGRDSLALTRGQKEVQTTLQTILARLDDLELTNKGLSQKVWQSTQESQEHLENAEQHYAGALRELETRIREEMQWQLYRSTLQAIFPALDDMDLVIGNQKVLVEKAGEEDGLLEAVILVRQKLGEGLRTLGLEEIAIEEGVTQFDPTLHEAVESDIPADLLPSEQVPPGTIVRVRRAGYRLNGRIFRVPQVLVKM